MEPIAGLLEKQMLFDHISPEMRPFVQELLGDRVYVDKQVLVVECDSSTDCLHKLTDTRVALFRAAQRYSCGLTQVRYQSGSFHLAASLKRIVDSVSEK